MGKKIHNYIRQANRIAIEQNSTGREQKTGSERKSTLIRRWITQDDPQGNEGLRGLGQRAFIRQLIWNSSGGMWANESLDGRPTTVTAVKFGDAMKNEARSEGVPVRFLMVRVRVTE
jgi:hypothetical protein